MMTITPPKNRITLNLEKIEEPILRIEKRISACIQDLNDSFQAFWGLSDEEINEILVHHGVEKITEIFTSHAENGTALNKLLEQRGISSPRAILQRPRELFINEEGNLQVVPVLPPEEQIIVENPEIGP